MGDPVLKIQTTERVQLLQMLKLECFVDKELRDLFGLVKNAVEVSNAVFAVLQGGPTTFQILDDLTAHLNISVEQIRALKTPRLNEKGRN